MDLSPIQEVKKRLPMAEGYVIQDPRGVRIVGTPTFPVSIQRTFTTVSGKTYEFSMPIVTLTSGQVRLSILRVVEGTYILSPTSFTAWSGFYRFTADTTSIEIIVESDTVENTDYIIGSWGLREVTANPGLIKLNSILGFNRTITGLRISADPDHPFIDNCPELLAFANKGIVTFYDSTGKRASATLLNKGTEETFSIEKLLNGGFDIDLNNWNTFAATLTRTNYDGISNVLSIADDPAVNGGLYSQAWQPITLASNGLYKLTGKSHNQGVSVSNGFIIVKDGSGEHVVNGTGLIEQDCSSVGLNVNAWVNRSLYVTSISNIVTISLNSNQTNTCYYDDISFKQTLTPSASGIYLSNFISIDSGFNFNQLSYRVEVDTIASGEIEHKFILGTTTTNSGSIISTDTRALISHKLSDDIVFTGPTHTAELATRSDELLSNYNFANGLANWITTNLDPNGYIGMQNYKLRMIRTVGSGQTVRIQQSNKINIGDILEITISINKASGGGNIAINGTLIDSYNLGFTQIGSNCVMSLVPGIYRFKMQAISADFLFNLWENADYTINYISVKKVLPLLTADTPAIVKLAYHNSLAQLISSQANTITGINNTLITTDDKMLGFGNSPDLMKHEYFRVYRSPRTPTSDGPVVQELVFDEVITGIKISALPTASYLDDCEALTKYTDGNHFIEVVYEPTGVKLTGMIGTRGKEILLGDEKLINRNFDTSYGWTLNGAWTIGTYCIAFNSLDANNLTQTVTLTPNGLYKNTFNIKSCIVGNVSLGDTTGYFAYANTPTFTGIGIKTVIANARSGQTVVNFRAHNSFNGCITDVSCKQMLTPSYRGVNIFNRYQGTDNAFWYKDPNFVFGALSYRVRVKRILSFPRNYARLTNSTGSILVSNTNNQLIIPE